MVRREIEIDADTDRLLTEMASDHRGDISSTITELIHARAILEEFADQREAAHATSLRALRDRSETDFREGRTVSWKM